MSSKVFLSYARHDKAIVDALAEDLRALADDVWVDERLTGGQAWWNVILAKISSAELFVLALSRASVISEACLAERGYAESVERPLLIIRIDNVDLRAAPAGVRRLQVVDYVPEDRVSLRGLARAVINASPAPPLPAVLPEPPSVPLTYGDRFPALFGGDVPMREQIRMLAELKLDINTDIHGEAARELLGILHDRPDTVWQVRDEIGQLLGAGGQPGGRSAAPEPSVAATPTTPLPAVGWYVDPTRRFELRYWDGTTWTEHACRAGEVFTDPIAGP